MNGILKSLNQRPIAYYPIYRKITGSTTAGILLSQLMYWFSKKDKFYKTDKDITEETLLTERELKTAKSKIKELSFIKITREGIPAKTYYEIDWDNYIKILSKNNVNNDTNNKEQNDLSSWDKSSELENTNRPNNKGQKIQTITKTSSETSSETSFLKKEKNIKKEKTLINSTTQELMTNLKVDENFVNEIIEYRKDLGKPLKTTQGLNGLLRKYLDIYLKLKLSPREIFEIQTENE